MPHGDAHVAVPIGAVVQDMPRVGLHAGHSSRIDVQPEHIGIELAALVVGHQHVFRIMIQTAQQTGVGREEHDAGRALDECPPIGPVAIHGEPGKRFVAGRVQAENQPFIVGPEEERHVPVVLLPALVPEARQAGGGLVGKAHGEKVAAAFIRPQRRQPFTVRREPQSREIRILEEIADGVLFCLLSLGAAYEQGNRKEQAAFHCCLHEPLPYLCCRRRTLRRLSFVFVILTLLSAE